MFNLFKKKERTQEESQEQSQEVTLYAMCDGELLNIEEVDDRVFAQKMMGDGFAIKPSSNQIYSPVKGQVDSVFPTKHAIGLKADKLELLLHMGIDTVHLDGGPFEGAVKANDAVDPQTLLSTVDFQALEEANKDNVMILVFTNGDEVLDHFELTASGRVSQGQKIGKVTFH